MLTREQWITALCSGDYRQAKGVLYDSDLNAFCCLGVACDLVGADRERMDRLETSQFDDVSKHELWPALGLTKDDCDELAMENDAGKTFKQIAILIEAKPFKRVGIDGYVEGEEPPLTEN